MISQKEFALRRKEIMKELGNGVLILSSFPEQYLTYDTTHKYRQNSDLLYFTNFPEPNSVGVFENSDENNENMIFHLFVPKGDKKFETYFGKGYGTEGAIKYFNVDQAYHIDELGKELTEILKKYENVFYTDSNDEKIDLIIKTAIKKAMMSKNRVGKGPVNVTNPIDTIHKMRSIKSEGEIKLLRKAAIISAKAHTRAMSVTKPRMMEFEVEALINYEFRKNGCSRSAYPTICGSGLNAKILHYIDNNAQMKGGDLLLVDAGGEFQSYASDISRTWPINGKFSDAQKEIYQLVLDTQKICINMIKPGIKFGEIQKKSIEMITAGLLDLGLLTGDYETNIAEKHYKRFYKHGLGHWIGIDTHDTPRIDRKGESLQPGHYFSVEPGIYIPDSDDIPIIYRGIGVRIEDNVLVTKNGFEILTNVVKEIEEIENLVGTSSLP